LTGILVLLLLLGILLKRKNISRALKALTTSEKDSVPYPVKEIPTPATPTVQSTTGLKGVNQVDDSDRMNPQQILKTLRENNGSVSKTASLLGIHRSTIHRWKQREQQQQNTGKELLVRKSTRPIHVRTSVIPADQIRHILMLHTKQHLTAKQIQKTMKLTVSDRTILRIIKNTTEYSNSEGMLQKHLTKTRI
jgi:transposase-like protein